MSENERSAQTRPAADRPVLDLAIACVHSGAVLVASLSFAGCPCMLQGMVCREWFPCLEPKARLAAIAWVLYHAVGCRSVWMPLRLYLKRFDTGANRGAHGLRSFQCTKHASKAWIVSRFAAFVKGVMLLQF